MQTAHNTDGTAMTIDRLKELFRQSNIKLTHQRLEIYRELTSLKGHLSAEEVHKSLQKRIPTLALDTVYRTLATFTGMGLITRLTLLGDRSLFDGNPTPHHHFFCTNCKTVHDVFLPDFDAADLDLDKNQIGTVVSRHIELKGLCANCASDRACNFRSGDEQAAS